MACTEPSMKRINALTKQLDRIEKKQEKAETAFNQLVEECAKFDSFLRENNNPKPEMQLQFLFVFHRFFRAVLSTH